jgi:site-specific recombinase XerD
MRSAVRRFLAHKEALRRSEHSLHEYRKRLRYFLDYARSRGVREVREITAGTARGYHDALMRRKLRGSTRTGRLATVRDFLSWAHENRLLLSDVAAKLEVPKPGKRLPPTPLRPEEMVRLLSLFKPEGRLGKRNRAIMEMLYACGLRRSELLRLNVGDVDFAAGTVFVRGKGGKERLLPVYEAALGAVTEYLAARGKKLPKTAPLFAVHYRKATQGKRMSEADLAHVFRQVCRHVHPHLLRHTYACHLLQGGADIRYVQALLGHEFPDTTSKYLGLVKEDIKRAYDQAVEGILDPEREAGELAGNRNLTAAPPRVAYRSRRAN